MESQQSCFLVLSGKSASEKDLAKSLKENASLKLVDGVKLSTCLQSEMENWSEIDEFNIVVETFEVYAEISVRSRLALCALQMFSLKDETTSSILIGRSQNVWESPKGSLLFSFTIEMEDGRVVPLVQYVVCLAMTEAIKDLALRNGIPPLNVRIKWPNDLYLDGLKVGGILCTYTYRSKKFNVSAGVGLNVDNDKPTTSLNSVLQKLTSDYRLQREDVTSAFFNKFEHLFNILINQGNGQRIIVQEKSNNQDLLIENVVTVQGLTSSRYLLAIADDGEKCELHPDGNRKRSLSNATWQFH
ncbi:holocarboxylase synthase 1 [Artemisia annua]|uniref:Holocarboxylase synthase 1 n=1 Tax=Artemisia annua TaxID=35608 RepID=A0A2U1LTR0_ARTAN|nr:holocarboxylase synthase 1 [Artemisia annua]